MPVSILILTFNEEINLPRCLESVSWSDDVIVFDSFSTDRTVQIAEAHGARVIQHRFDNYGAQREAARSQVGYKYPWVLSVDADEEPDPQLIQEIRRIAESGQAEKAGHDAYRMRRKDYLMGKWIRHATLYPSWFVRLYRPDRVRYEPRTVHEYPTVGQGSVGELEGHLIHHSFNKGIGDWFAKHNQYAALEAQESLKALRDEKIDWPGLVSLSDPVRRRRALKGFAIRLPLRPAFRFVYMYLLRGGVLDGRAGLTYCTFLSIYEYLIVIKMKELRRRQRDLPV